MDIRTLDRQAVTLAGAVISQVRPDHLRLPTPCADWTLYGLLRHLVSEDQAFAATAAGESTVDWTAGRLGPDPVADHHRTAAAYLAAFEPDDVLTQPMKINVFGVFPGAVAVSMHLVDTVVHAWDVAKTIGVPFEPDEDLVTATLAVLRRFPADRPNPAFGVDVPVPDDAGPLAQLLSRTGRDPDWSTVEQLAGRAGLAP